MDMKMKIITAVAVLSTAVAVVEGVMLVKASQRNVPAVVAQAPAAGESASGDGAGLAASRGQGETVDGSGDLPGSAEANGSGQAKAGRAAPESPESAGKEPGATAADATAASAVAPEGVELTAEEKAAQEAALAMKKLDEAMVTMAEQQIKELVKRFNLNEVQLQAAEPTIDKLRQSLLKMMIGPRQLGEQMGQRMKEIREEALLQGQTEEQIAAIVKPEQTRMVTQIQELVTGGMTEMSTALEELRPILDVTQTATLDQMNRELREQQAMVGRMMDSMKNSPPPAP